MEKSLQFKRLFCTKIILASVLLFRISVIDINAKSQASGVITFQGTNGAVFGADNIATAGEGGSTAIAGISIQTYAIGANNNTVLPTSAGILNYYDINNAGGYPQNEITYNGKVTPQTPQGEFYGLLVRSADGSNFRLTSLNFVDWGGWIGENWTVEGFDNGVSKGKGTFKGSTTGAFVALTHASILSTAFDNIDEVRIHKTDNSLGWIGINNIAIDSPVLAPDPIFTTQPVAAAICTNANTTFKTAVTNAVKYQWQVNTGTGFKNIADNAIYSGATTVNLAITAATAAMNGYTYRMVATGTNNDVNSNAVTLTVNNITVIPGQVNVSCNGGKNGSAIVAIQSGIGPFTYSWTNSASLNATASNIAAGTYIATVTGAYGCNTTQSITITEPLAIDVTTSLSGGTVTANANSATYQWLDCNKNQSLINGEINKSFTPATTGSYSVVVTKGGCSDTSVCVKVTVVITGIEEENVIINNSVYPNPSNGVFSIETHKTQQVNITNVLGLDVASISLQEGKNDIRLALANGIYFVKIDNKTVRIVIQ